MNIENDKDLIEGMKQWEEKGYQKHEDMTLDDVYMHRSKIQEQMRVLKEQIVNLEGPPLDNIISMKLNVVFLVLLGMREFDITGRYCGENNE